MNVNIIEFLVFLEDFGFESWDDCEDDSDTILYVKDAGEIKIRVYKDLSTFDIFYDFPYYDIEKTAYDPSMNITDIDDDMEDNLMSDINKYWIKKRLENIIYKEPIEEFDEYSYLCPGSNLYLGYFNCDIVRKKYIIEAFCSIDSINNGNFISQESNNAIAQIINNVLKDVLIDKGFNYDCNSNLFVSKSNNYTIVINEEDLLEKTKKHTNNVENFYYGKEYILMKSSTNEIFSIKKQDLNIFETINDILGWFGDNSYLYDSTNQTLIIINGFIMFSVKLEKHLETFQDLEYMYLMDLFYSISEFRTNAELSLCDFSHLTPSDFEQLSCELLEKMGFKNIHPIGQTNTPDGGRDFIAEEIINSNVGTEKRVYVVQCKRSKNALKREAIGEIDSLLRENNAEKYLLICSSNLSTQTIDRLEKQNVRRTNKVTYWGKVELSMQLSKYKDLISKYRLLGNSLLPYMKE